MNPTLNSHTHYQAAPANAPTKALSKSLQTSPREKFQNFSPTLKRKKLNHANTQATQTEKENETNDKFNMKVQFDRNQRTDKNHQCITRFIKNWADATEIKGCGSLQTLYRFDSDVLRSAQLFIYRNR